jgi:uncharacterized protein YqhQ
MASERTPQMGGIALANGLIFVTEKHWAAAIRDSEGQIKKASGTRPRLGSALGKVPLLRGVSRFGETVFTMARVRAELPGAVLLVESQRVVKALGISLAAGGAVKALAGRSAVVEEAGTALAAFIPAVLVLRDSPVTAYHGAEHKLIGGREAMNKGLDKASATKEHDRCGSNLVGPLLAMTVLGNLLARKLGVRNSPVASAITGAVGLGASIEILRWSAKHESNPFARLFLSPGRVMQKHLTTTEPSAEQLEVGETALRELLRLEALNPSPLRDEPLTPRRRPSAQPA